MNWGEMFCSSVFILSQMELTGITIGVGEDCLRDADFEISIFSPAVSAVNASASQPNRYGPPVSKGSQFLCSQLKASPEWKRWQEAEFNQLDDMTRNNVFGKILQHHEINCNIDIIRPVWSYVHKLLQDKIKMRFCGHGHPLKPKTKMEEKVYTVCTTMV